MEGLIAGYEFDVVGLARRASKPPYPLPTEPGTLGNILETTALGYLFERLRADPSNVMATRGGQRTYPDAELKGGILGQHLIALDVKVARRANLPARATVQRRTQSRITLLTGNTYFARPDLPHPSISRPYNSFTWHLDWVILFDIDPSADFPEVSNVESIISETWRIASKQRSSETRNYIGAVATIDALRAKQGDFDSREEFESFWRAHTRWRTTPGVSQASDIDG